ncbi:MAG: type I restriction endonuclease subunit R [Crocinitomicaceae bacterium]
MTTQAEAILENELVKQLAGQGYARVQLLDEVQMLMNLQEELGAFNKTKFTTKEFQAILNHLQKGNVFEKAKTLRDRFHLERDDGTSFYVRFFDSDVVSNNVFQVTQQITRDGIYKNRYDVTILVNGLPLVQIELKRRGLEMKEAFNQIMRYDRHSFHTGAGLFGFVQIFVISNGVNTKYFANTVHGNFTFKQTFFWADENNRNITQLESFTKAFLDTTHLSRMIANYIVLNETHKILMVLRPYQYYAVEAIIRKVTSLSGSSDSTRKSTRKSSRKSSVVEIVDEIGGKNQGEGNQVEKNGYIWHTTGSGKTLTSFKASQIIMNLPEVKKVVFVVDRKDLDYQTMKEFNSFKKDAVDVTSNTKSLVNQFKDDKSPLILTTIQKLNNAITPGRYLKSMEQLQHKNIVFIFDECHRSQFGDTHKRITNFFTNAQLFGFTGTPIFADNAAKNDLGKRTTKDLFGDCLHRYTIQNAISDQNVLKFNVEYVGRYKKKSDSPTLIDIEVEDIDKQEVYDDPRRFDLITDYIIQQHDAKTHNRAYSALFAVSSIDHLMKYYQIFKNKKEAGQHNLRIAGIYTYGTNEEDSSAAGHLPDLEADDLMLAERSRSQAAEPDTAYKDSHSREKLDEIIADYNALYNTGFSTRETKEFEKYFQDISRRLKEREKAKFKDSDRLDIVLVVNMMLTGFDAKKVNTLYADKNLRYHGLIQAFSRTNRILNEQKSQGNIVCFRNLKDKVDEAISLFSDEHASEEILLPPYEDVANKFDDAYQQLMKTAPTVDSVNELQSENEEMAFVVAFRSLTRIKNVLTSFADFDWDDLPIDEQTFMDYQSKYLDLRDKVKNEHKLEKSSILNDIDFEVELIHRDKINVAYILKLLTQTKGKTAPKIAAQKKKIMDMLSSEIELRSKRELIEKFIEENLPKISNPDDIKDEFQKYWKDQKVLALNKLCEEEGLDRAQFKALIETYLFTEKEPLRDQVFKCLDNRPSILKAREIGERIIEKMKEYVEIFELGMVG